MHKKTIFQLKEISTKKDSEKLTICIMTCFIDYHCVFVCVSDLQKQRMVSTKKIDHFYKQKKPIHHFDVFFGNRFSVTALNYPFSY